MKRSQVVTYLLLCVFTGVYGSNARFAEADTTKTLYIKPGPPDGQTSSAPGIIVRRLDDETPQFDYSLSIADATVRESDGTMSFSVSLSQAGEQAVSFTYQLSDGTATAGSDYTADSGMLSLPPGKTSAEIVVSLLDDGFHEEEESFTIQLSAVSGAAEGKLTAIGTIKDDDALPSLTIGESTASENSQKMVFTAQLNFPGSEPVTVDYETQDTGGEQHAIAGSDYTAAKGTFTIPAGSTSATIEVAITKDANNDEGDEFFQLVLSNPVNATLVTAQAAGTIQNGAGHAGGPGGGDGAAVPEPSTIGLMFVGLLSLGLAAKRRRN